MKINAFIFFVLCLTTINTFSLKSKDLSSKPKTTFTEENQRPQVMPGQIRVKFKQQIGELKLLKAKATMTGIASFDGKIARYGVQSIEKSFKHRPISKSSNIPDISRIYTLHFAEDKDVNEIAKALATDPNIEYAEPIPIYYLEVQPNDPLFSQQDHLEQILMQQSWDIARGDSNIIIAIIDGGTDWNHPDLVENIWTNQAELEGLRGFDDDHNGYIDDIHGWDFAENDNNPTNQPSDLDTYYHGTVTAGLASARTNNDLKVAGVSWNCKIMPLKNSRDNVERAIYDWPSGAIYAAENGAHVINMSFGGFNEPFQAGQDVIDYVYYLGVVVVASAGNESDPNPNHYPSGYRHVISVTWVNSSDILTTYSPYGLQVDVAAPGVELLSLSPGNSTIKMSGSSSSAPLVSGLAALIKSQHPGWGPSQIMRQIFLTANNIDNANPQYAGKIGSGRINAYRALTEINPPENAPRIKLIGLATLTDTNRGDNMFERGESGVVTVASTYRNYSISPASNLLFTITTDDSDITINNGAYNYGYFPPDTTVTTQFSLNFMVNKNAKGKIAKIYLGWRSYGGYSGIDTTFKVIVGKIPILVVDDDSDVNDIDFPYAEKFYTNILDHDNVNYALWDRYRLGSLEPDQITNFPIIIWFCSWCFPSLNSDDQRVIANFLDNGGSLFISGQDIGWDFNDVGGSGYQQRDFYSRYLHARYYADDSPVNKVVGILDDPIGDGMQFIAWQTGLTEENQFPDEIEPDTGATAVFEYAGGANHKFGIKYQGTHKVVYFSMGLEAIDSQQNSSPDDLSPVRTEVFSRVLNWLNFIDHEPLTDTENLTNPSIVTVCITNTMATKDLSSVELHWRNASQQVFKIIPMTNDGKYQFRAEIPNPGENSRIEYFIKMVNSYYEWTNPQGAPDNFYSYHVGSDQIAPTFSHVPLKSSFIEKKPRQILVSAKDNIALNTNTVYVHYASKSVSDSIKLKTGENPEQFSGYLPAIFAYGDTVSYYFSGYDKAASPNRGQSMLFSFIVGFEDFESGLNNWIVSPDGWGLVKGMPYSGNYAINDSPNQVSYSNNRDVSITTSLGFDLSNSDHAALKFWTRVFLEINSDFGYVEISNDGGKTWKQLGDAINDFNETWEQQILSLSDYCGSGNTDVRLRFRMVSDSHQGPPVPGWFIDDVQIIEGLEVTRVAEQNNAIIPEKFALYQNYPNPFNPNTTIQFDLSQSGKVTVKIFNIRGELIRTLIQSQVNAGSHVVNWDGRDENGQNLASGLYFYQLTVNSFSATKKLLLIK